MKNIIKVIVTVMLGICIMGCKKETMEMPRNIEASESIETTEAEKKVRYAERYQMVSLSEAGIIYTGDERVRLAGIDGGDDMILCYNPNCIHQNAKVTYGDPECMAALYESYCDIAYYEGTIYFFVEDGINNHRIYKMNTNGAGRELLAKFPFGYSVAYAIFCEDKLYYIAEIAQKDEIKKVISYNRRIVEVDINDGTYRFLTEESEDLVANIDLAGNNIYIRRADKSNNGTLYMVAIDIETLEEKIIISTEEWLAGNRYIDVYDEDSYYYYDCNKYEIGIKNIDGTIEQVLVKGAEGETFGWADPSCDGLFYKREFDYDDEKAGAYFLDMETGEVTNITDEQVKYSLVGYDGYYDAFVSRDSEFNWGMWSKEKVLSEAKE